jgi:hypothetical protein
MSTDEHPQPGREPGPDSGRRRPDLDGARAAQAASGKWHLIGEHGCLNAGQASFADAASAVVADQRNREWCRYCGGRLRILQLRAELDRVREQRDELARQCGADVDAESDRPGRPSTARSPNHRVSARRTAAPHSGWGQRTEDGGEQER